MTKKPISVSSVFISLALLVLTHFESKYEYQDAKKKEIKVTKSLAHIIVYSKPSFD